MEENKMKMIYHLPIKEPIVHRLRGKVERTGEGIFLVGGLHLPQHLEKKLLRRCKTRNLTREVKEREFMVHGAPGYNGYINWFGLTSGEFMSIPFQEITKAFRKLKVRPVVKETGDKRLVFNYPVASLPGSANDSARVNLMFDSGEYGVYGGNGESAVSFGVSVYDEICLNQTLFLNRFGKRRFVHRDLDVELDDIVEEASELSYDVSQRWMESMETFYCKDEVEAYAAEYGARFSAKRLFDRVLNQVGNEVSAYNLAWHITREAQKVSDTTRRKLELLAGEVIMCPKDIKKGYS
jgi:hypothetical protein